MTPPAQDLSANQTKVFTEEDRQDLLKRQAADLARRNQLAAQEAEKLALKEEYYKVLNDLHLLDAETRESRSVDLLLHDYKMADRLLDLCTNVDSGLPPSARLIGTLHARQAVPENEHKVERAERVELEIFAEHPDLMQIPLNAKRFEELQKKFGPRISPAGPWVQDKPSL